MVGRGSERLESEQGESIRSHIMSEGFVTPENEADVDRYIAEVLRVPGAWPIHLT